MHLYLDLTSILIGGVIGIIVGAIAASLFHAEGYDDFHWH